MKVIVSEYNESWLDLYRKEASIIEEVFEQEIVAIHHMGSTSVKGLKAKPIIDILLVIKDIANIDTYNEKMANLGYEAMGECGIEKRRFFRKGGNDRTHHVHAFQEDNKHEINRHLAFRDYLREHPHEASLYGELKQKLATLFPQDIEGYMDGKDAFVKKIEAQALKWKSLNA